MPLSTSPNKPSTSRPRTLKDLRASGWQSKTVKQEIYDNFLRMLSDGDELFPGIVGYDSTVIPEINIALLAKIDMPSGWRREQSLPTSLAKSIRPSSPAARA